MDLDRIILNVHNSSTLLVLFMTISKKRKICHELKSWMKLLIKIYNNNNNCVQDFVMAYLVSSFYPQFIIQSKSEH